MNQVDASVFYDLLRLVVNRNDDKTKVLADQLFDIYGNIAPNLGPTDVKYSELYISLIKEILMARFTRDKHRIDIRNLVQRYTNNQIFRKDRFILDAFKDILENETEPSRLVDIVARLNNLIAWYISRDYITKLYGYLKESSVNYTIEGQTEAIGNVRSLVDDFKTKLVEIGSITGKSGPVETIDFQDKDSMKAAFTMFRERRVVGSLKTGLQGLNQILGDGGIALGESLIFAARSHNFKSGMLMKMPLWISKYSKPAIPVGKKPMILVISLENEAYMNMLQMFKQIYASVNGHLPSSTLSDEEMIESIYSYFDNTEYTLVIQRFLPSNFGYDEYIWLVESYENAGYKIVASVVDYVALMKLHNGNASRSGDHALLQELYCKMVNYNKAIGSSLITAHQLNRGASDLVASGIPHPVKRFSERHFAGSTGIFREVDKVVYLEIEADEEGNSWLTMQFGKARYQDNIPESKRFCAYKFNEIGLTDDIDVEFGGVRNIYKKNASTATQQDIEAILGITDQSAIVVN